MRVCMCMCVCVCVCVCVYVIVSPIYPDIWGTKSFNENTDFWTIFQGILIIAAKFFVHRATLLR